MDRIFNKLAVIFNFSAHKDYWGAEGGLRGKMPISRYQLVNSDLVSVFGDPPSPRISGNLTKDLHF